MDAAESTEKERYIESVRSRLGADVFSEMREQGRGMTMEQAIEYAMQPVDLGMEQEAEGPRHPRRDHHHELEMDEMEEIAGADHEVLVLRGSGALILERRLDTDVFHRPRAAQRSRLGFFEPAPCRTITVHSLKSGVLARLPSSNHLPKRLP